MLHVLYHLTVFVSIAAQLIAFGFPEVLSDSQALEVDLLCLPGGYLMVRSILERDEFSQIIRNEAEKHGIAVAIGIDIDAGIKDLRKYSLHMIKKNTLPFFAICWSTNEKTLILGDSGL